MEGKTGRRRVGVYSRSVECVDKHHTARMFFSGTNSVFISAAHAKLSGQSGSITRRARSTGYESNVGPDGSGTHFMSIVDGDDDDLLGAEKNSQLEQALSSLCLDDHVVQMAQGDLGAIHRAA